MRWPPSIATRMSAAMAPPYIAGDLREPAAVRGRSRCRDRAFGRIDLLVNNAGATKRGDFLALTEPTGRTASR